MSKKKIIVQMSWGIALVLAGIGVFIRIPQVMPQIETIEHFSSVIFVIRFCFYLLGILLIVGGAKKIYDYSQKLEDSSSSDQEQEQ